MDVQQGQDQGPNQGTRCKAHVFVDIFIFFLIRTIQGVYIDAQGRRVWDKDFFSHRGAPVEEEEEKEELHVSKRKKTIDFSKTLGVSVTDGDSRKVGFVCKICNHCSKDSSDYLDHLNDPSRM